MGFEESTQATLSDSPTSRMHWAMGCGWLLVAVFVGFLAVIGDYRPHVRLFQIAWAVGFLGYAIVLRTLWKTPREGIPGRPAVWIAGFVLLRLALLHAAPSDDLHRYVWEGKIQAYGFNPYLLAPDDERLSALAEGDSNFPRINHPDYPAIYPPLAQLTFRGVAALSESAQVMKAVMVVGEVAALVLLACWLSAAGGAPQKMAVYAMNPLVLTAIAVDGHLDSLMLVCLAGAGWAASRNRLTACGAAVGLAISAKLVAVVLLPWLMFRKPLAAAIAMAVTLLAYLPFADAGWHVFDSLRRFGSSTLVNPLVGFLDGAIGGGAARALCAGGLIVFALWLARRRVGFAVYATRMFAGLVLVLPIVHAWYLVWLVFFAWARLRVSWLVLTAAMLLYYEAERQAFLTGVWTMPAWAPTGIATVFTVAWIAETMWRTRRPMCKPAT